ncbi:hypothetical protein ACFFRR_003783 [Megaselia abdita]
MSLKVVYSLACIIAFTSAQICRTPDNKNGICMEFSQCQAFNFNFFFGVPPTDELKKIIEASKCPGSDNEICCPFASQYHRLITPQFKSAQPPQQNMWSNRIENSDTELNGEHCGEMKNTNKIANGNKTSVGEFPFMVLLKAQNADGSQSFKCGGTLITPRYVLTAAHCISDDLLSVRIGENTIDKDPDCDVSNMGVKKCAPTPLDLEIEEKIVHPEYKQKRVVYDIGLLRLKSPVTLDRTYVNTICLPTTETLQKQDTEDRFLVAGWGKTEKTAGFKDLLKATVSRQSSYSCRTVFKTGFIPDDLLICAGGENQIDTCLGDSGGPLFWKARINSGSRYIQRGVTGKGYFGCGQLLNGRTPPTMYTNVASHIEWIRNSMY